MVNTIGAHDGTARLDVITDHASAAQIVTRQWLVQARDDVRAQELVSRERERVISETGVGAIVDALAEVGIAGNWARFTTAAEWKASEVYGGALVTASLSGQGDGIFLNTDDLDSVYNPLLSNDSRARGMAAGTDATRVASYNPWVSLAWLVTGITVGGLRIYPQRNCLDRETALRRS